MVRGSTTRAFADGTPHIAMMSSDGPDRRQITSDEVGVWPAVSPDGATVAYFGIRGDQVGVWRANADGTDARLLAAAHA
jgi:Tol biopolymer transport system component